MKLFGHVLYFYVKILLISCEEEPSNSHNARITQKRNGSSQENKQSKPLPNLGDYIIDGSTTKQSLMYSNSSNDKIHRFIEKSFHENNVVRNSTTILQRNSSKIQSGRSGRFLPYVSVVEDRIDQQASLQTSSDTPSESSFSLINSILGVLTAFVTVIQNFISGFGSSKSIKKSNTKVTSGPSDKVPSASAITVPDDSKFSNRISKISSDCPDTPKQNIQSKDEMEAAGWVLDVDYINNKNYEAMCKANPFWGYGYLRDGEISTVFEGTGKGALVFGNCHSRGAVYVNLNRKRIGYAPPSQLEIVSNFEYKPGDKLVLQDIKSGITSIKSLTLSCYGTPSTSSNEVSDDKMPVLPQQQIKLHTTSIKPQLITTKLPPKMPNYRYIKGYKQCLGRNKKRNQLFPTDCLYQTQPRNCKDASWKKLYEIIGKGGLELCDPKDPVIECCQLVGVPEECSWFCQDEKLNMIRSNRPVTGICRDWIPEISKCWDKETVSYTALESCCIMKGVPRGCIGICRGSCDETHWDTYNLLPNYQACNAYVRKAKNCCDEKS